MNNSRWNKRWNLSLEFSGVMLASPLWYYVSMEIEYVCLSVNTLVSLTIKKIAWDKVPDRLYFTRYFSYSFKSILRFLYFISIFHYLTSFPDQKKKRKWRWDLKKKWRHSFSLFMIVTIFLLSKCYLKVFFSLENMQTSPVVLAEHISFF